MSDMIQFPSERGFSAAQANDALAVGYSLIDRGVVSDVELDQTETGAVYLWLEREDGIGWIAAQESSLYVLFRPGQSDRPLVSSRDFSDLIEGLKAIAS